MIKKFYEFNESLKKVDSGVKRKFVPSGWVNVKVDNELSIRISRYVKSLDKTLATRHRANLYEKINKLGNISSIKYFYANKNRYNYPFTIFKRDKNTI